MKLLIGQIPDEGILNAKLLKILITKILNIKILIFMYIPNMAGNQSG